MDKLILFFLSLICPKILAVENLLSRSFVIIFSTKSGQTFFIDECDKWFVTYDCNVDSQIVFFTVHQKRFVEVFLNHTFWGIVRFCGLWKFGWAANDRTAKPVGRICNLRYENFRCMGFVMFFVFEIFLWKNKSFWVKFECLWVEGSVSIENIEARIFFAQPRKLWHLVDVHIVCKVPIRFFLITPMHVKRGSWFKSSCEEIGLDQVVKQWTQNPAVDRTILIYWSSTIQVDRHSLWLIVFGKILFWNFNTKFLLGFTGSCFFNLQLSISCSFSTSAKISYFSCFTSAKIWLSSFYYESPCLGCSSSPSNANSEIFF